LHQISSGRPRACSQAVGRELECDSFVGLDAIRQPPWQSELSMSVASRPRKQDWGRRPLLLIGFAALPIRALGFALIPRHR
jgi:hypothetical protein